MQDDVTTGAYAPAEAGTGSWTREDGASRRGTSGTGDHVRVGLTAVVLSVVDEEPVVLVVSDAVSKSGVGVDCAALPTCQFRPLDQPSLEVALREAVRSGTGRELGYTEQLLTDYGPVDEMQAGETRNDRSQLSVSYLALTRADGERCAPGARWLNCYALLPWEDFRIGRPTLLVDVIMPALEAWADTAVDQQAGGETAVERRERVGIAFGGGGRSWDDQRVVDRYDLIVEAGIDHPSLKSLLGHAHLRLVAAGLGRLRGKLRYRPVVFEILAPEFTLFELQRTVEAVLGPTLHKQNFRRLVEGTGLVEATGDVRTNTGGRPAKTFRFRREVLLERPTPGVHVRAGRAA